MYLNAEFIVYKGNFYLYSLYIDTSMVNSKLHLVLHGWVSNGRGVQS